MTGPFTLTYTQVNERLQVTLTHTDPNSGLQIQLKESVQAYTTNESKKAIKESVVKQFHDLPAPEYLRAHPDGSVTEEKPWRA